MVTAADGSADGAAASRTTSAIPRRAGGIRRSFSAHSLFATVLLLGLAVRVATNWAYRPIFIYPDSTYYLIWAKLWRPGDARPVGYSIFVRGLLDLQGVDLIAVVQGGLGLLLGVFIYVYLVRWGCRRWVAAIATIPVLLDPLESLLEHYLLSDVLANVLIVGALVAIGWSRRFERQAAAIAGLMIGCATVVRSGSALVAIVLGLFILLTRTPWVPRLGQAAVYSLTFCIPVLAYMGWMQAERHTFALTDHYNGRFLYGRVVVFADCRRISLPDYERQLCPGSPPDPHKQDYYMWDPSAPQWNLKNLPSGVTPNDVTKDFAKRAIMAEPIGYGKAVAKDFLYNFSLTRGTGPEGHPNWFLKYQDHYPASVPASNQAISDYGRGSAIKVRSTTAKALHIYGKAYVPGLVFGLCLVVGALGALKSRLGRGIDRPVLSLLFTAGTVAALLSPALFSLFSLRYMAVQLMLAPVAGALGWTEVITRANWERLGALIHRRRPSP